MKASILVFFLICIQGDLLAQLYFPPNNSNEWSTINPESLGWCTKKIDSLYSFLEANKTKAFILLKDGKIVLEKYLNGHTASTNWYWASAGKTLTSVLVGIAQQENLLKISDQTSKYLGKAWTSCSPEQEDKITIRHQLTMTSGLDDGVSDPFCTLKSCLIYKADASTRWAYHNGPYTLLDDVIEKATGKTLNQYNTQKIKNITGMDGLYIRQEYNNIYFSTARSMARFGLLMLNKGSWNGVSVISDPQYFEEMTTTSQNINESYGYLWWLNGKSSYMIPQTQVRFQGSFNKSAPEDMFSGMGKNGQFVNVIPSQNMVWIRLGDNPDNALVPFLFNEDIWKFINDLSCTTATNDDFVSKQTSFDIYPSPTTNELSIDINSHADGPISIFIFDLNGKIVFKEKLYSPINLISTTTWSPGIYKVILKNKDFVQVKKVVKI